MIVSSLCHSRVHCQHSSFVTSLFRRGGVRRRHARHVKVRKCDTLVTSSACNPSTFGSVPTGDGLREIVKAAFSEAVTAVLSRGTLVDVNISECSNNVVGDYQCNSAMPIFAELKQKGDTSFSNPRSLAEAIVEAIPGREHLFAQTSVAGPGFVNVTFSASFLAAGVLDTVVNSTDEKIRIPPQRNMSIPKRAVVDYSSPNIAKASEMHVGHLRSTIIGETICRALESFGVETVRLNHVGDWGTQFGMLLTHLHDMQMGSDFAITDLQEFYKVAKLRFDKDDDFKARAQSAVVRLQAGDVQMRKLWEEICEISRRDFEEIYRVLDISIIERGESFYNEIIPLVLDELVKKGIAVEDQGALCIFGNLESTPLICRKSDGGFNYASTDLAALWQRTTQLEADQIIYVTDVGQSKHFEAIFDAANRAGWLDKKDNTKIRLDHVGFGLVMGEDGKRFRTRSGGTVPLRSLLSEAQSRCLESLQTRSSDLDDKELLEASHIMGIAAVKYADLHNNRSTNYVFSYDRMLDMKGNTAVYLLYTHARISTLLSRAEDQDLTSPAHQMVFTDEKERALAVAILKLPDALRAVVQDLLPSRLCDYAYHLCVAYNEFYSTCKVIGSPEEKSRLILCRATVFSLRRALFVLGITPLHKL
ncbi:arginyl-tRNA synthetase [Micromonas commoda]|uniref:arginine--tRNA ligase n=1 Tax=Micromonas commoda (strain RCC299 / NOUM17 / CCMP2709) TaxID=296587 RepID=C1FDG1_MICCC|nr:arginyl-tRNA synthetase [Micromonas commoda]ACO68782.1 arginyl-tRNA synthetase [Micromonas commoda]|eukprot:XP_002507524.1 arginyl-tRNA synthetase [Micromonas commoda]